jgi:enoyl-CoA hydratase/carnithine racemase
MAMSVPAAACDFLIASEDARWSYEGTRGGGTPPNGAYLILSFQLPMRVMNKLYMMGGWFTASDAIGWDFVQRVVPVDEVRSEARRWAAQAGKIPLQQYSAAKTSLRRVYEISGLSAAVGAQNMVSGHGSDSDLEFRQAVRDKGLRAAVRDRDSGFDQEVGRV